MGVIAVAVVVAMSTGYLDFSSDGSKDNTVPAEKNELVGKKWTWVKTQMSDDALITPKRADRILEIKDGQIVSDKIN